MTCNMFCLTNSQSGSVSVAAYPISTVSSLDLSSESSCNCQHCMWNIFCQIFNCSIFSRLSCFYLRPFCCCMLRVFNQAFCEKKIYWIFLFNMRASLLIKGQFGLVSLATYRISTLSMIHLTSDSTCTCLCSIQAPGGIFCLFENSTISCCSCVVGSFVTSLMSSRPCVKSWHDCFFCSS